MLSSEDVDYLVLSFQQAIDERSALSIRHELIERMIWDGGMDFWMREDVKAVRFWRVKERRSAGNALIVAEESRCRSLLERGEQPEYDTLYRLLEDMDNLKEWRQ